MHACMQVAVVGDLLEALLGTPLAPCPAPAAGAGSSADSPGSGSGSSPAHPKELRYWNDVVGSGATWAAAHGRRVEYNEPARRPLGH